MTPFVSAIFYLLTFALSATLISVGKKRNRKSITAVGLSVPILISGFRLNVGTDYETYIKLISSVDNMSWGQFSTHPPADIESSFFLMAQFSNLFTSDGLVYFLLSSLVTVVFLFLGLKRYKIKNLGLAFFLMLAIVFPVTFNGVRQGMAIAISFYAISFALDKKLIHHYLLIIMASLLHNSALILLPLYPLIALLRKKPGNSGRFIASSIILFLAAILIMPLSLDLLANIPTFEKFLMYEDSGVVGSNNVFMLKVFMVFIFFIIYNYLSSSHPYVHIFIILSVLEAAITYIGFDSPEMKRAALYLSMFQILSLSHISLAFKPGAGRRIAYSAVIIYGVLFFLVSYFILGHSDVIPYNFYRNEIAQ